MCNKGFLPFVILSSSKDAFASSASFDFTRCARCAQDDKMAKKSEPRKIRDSHGIKKRRSLGGCLLPTSCCFTGGFLASRRCLTRRFAGGFLARRFLAGCLLASCFLARRLLAGRLLASCFLTRRLLASRFLAGRLLAACRLASCFLASCLLARCCRFLCGALARRFLTCTFDCHCVWSHPFSGRKPTRVVAYLIQY
jgi:hypothetical protein